MVAVRLWMSVSVTFSDTSLLLPTDSIALCWSAPGKAGASGGGRQEETSSWCLVSVSIRTSHKHYHQNAVTDRTTVSSCQYILTPAGVICIGCRNSNIHIRVTKGHAKRSEILTGQLKWLKLFGFFLADGQKGQQGNKHWMWQIEREQNQKGTRKVLESILDVHEWLQPRLQCNWHGTKG